MFAPPPRAAGRLIRAAGQFCASQNSNPNVRSPEIHNERAQLERPATGSERARGRLFSRAPAPAPAPAPALGRINDRARARVHFTRDPVGSAQIQIDDPDGAPSSGRVRSVGSTVRLTSQHARRSSLISRSIDRSFVCLLARLLLPAPPPSTPICNLSGWPREKHLCEIWATRVLLLLHL